MSSGCQIGDEVQIVESHPMSHDKRWVVEKIVKRTKARANRNRGRENKP